MKIGVIGAGSWGTALACLLAGKNFHVDLWVRRLELCKEIIRRRVNPVYLPNVRLPQGVSPSSDLEKVVHGKKIIFLVVPSKTMREVVCKIKPYLSADACLVSAAKGLEPGSMFRMSEIIGQVLPDFKGRIAVVSGPNHAEEVSRGIPTATVVAAKRREIAEFVQEVLTTSTFRVYTNPDMIGVELGGALKNIIALGAGVSDGMGFGDNTKASLVTRGLVEMTRLGVAMGARPSTFSGLSGIGDLFATCNSIYSRNRNVGYRLGKGER
ncbi:MAG: NAD(P)H-dependent glycerol-3-phosphate dehydrogenase, partial [Dethiobacteria bacterium]